MTDIKVDLDDDHFILGYFWRMPCSQCASSTEYAEKTCGCRMNGTPPQIRPHTLRDRLQELCAQISTLSETLKGLYAERDLIQGHLDSVVYPILTLPLEITSEIFSHCLPPNILMVEPSTSAAPLLLTEICRTWRTIALSTPGLWRCLAIKLDSRAYRLRLLPEFLLMWLSRAGLHQTTLSLRYAFERTRPTPPTILDTILRHAHHLTDLQLALPFVDYVYLFRTSHGPWPSLKRIEAFSSDKALPVIFTGLKSTSSLCKLVVDGELLDPFLSTDLPWTKIARFKALRINVGQCYRLLIVASSLEDCTLNIDDNLSFDPFPLVPPLKPLTELKFLTLKGSGGAQFSQATLLSHLTLPALTDIRLAIGVNDAPIFCSFISRSSCLITHLHITCPLDEDNFARCLTTLTSLVELETQIKHGTVSFDLLSSVLHSRKTLLPKLSRLNVYVDAMDPAVHYPGLADMLASRWDDPKVGRLQAFELRFLYTYGGGPDAASMRRLKVLAQQGMDIKITFGSGRNVVIYDSRS